MHLKHRPNIAEATGRDKEDGAMGNKGYHHTPKCTKITQQQEVIS